MKWLKENTFLAVVILVVLAITIVTSLPIIMNIGDGSFFKGILLLIVALVGGVLIFNAFARLFEDLDSVWKVVLCFFGLFAVHHVSDCCQYTNAVDHSSTCKR